MLSSDFHCKENDGTTGAALLWSKSNFVLKSHRICWTPQSDRDFMNTIITDDESWVYGYDQESKSFRHFPYNENSTRAVNTN